MPLGRVEYSQLSFDGDVSLIVLSGSRPRRTTQINRDDHDLVSPFVWYYLKGYAAARTEHGVLFLHRLIMGADDDLAVHHRDFDKLNNRRDNLQAMTHEEHRRLHSLHSRAGPG